MTNPFSSVPPQPTDFFAVNAWVATYIRPAMRAWLNSVLSIFQSQGFAVQVLQSTIDSMTSGVETASVSATIRVSKSGAFEDLLIQPSDGFKRDPETYVSNYLMVQWPFVVSQQTGTPGGSPNQYTLPNPAVQPSTQTPAATATAPAMTGQTVIVISPETMTAAEQGGANPTVQTNPASGTANPNLTEKIAAVPTAGVYNPHQWNYIFREATGFDGPAPEAVGLNGDEVMSFGKWSAATSPWFRATYAEFGAQADGGGGTDTGGTNADGSPAPSAASSVFTLIGAILALFGFGR